MTIYYQKEVAYNPQILQWCAFSQTLITHEALILSPTFQNFTHINGLGSSPSNATTRPCGELWLVEGCSHMDPPPFHQKHGRVVAFFVPVYVAQDLFD